MWTFLLAAMEVDRGKARYEGLSGSMVIDLQELENGQERKLNMTRLIDRKIRGQKIVGAVRIGKKGIKTDWKITNREVESKETERERQLK